MAIFSFDEPAQAEAALARHLAGLLAEELAAKGEAALALSGGRSPVGLFELLARMPLPTSSTASSAPSASSAPANSWERVRLSLVDERLVPPQHPDSNALLVRTHLLGQSPTHCHDAHCHPAAAAKFTPLVEDASLPEAELVRRANETFIPPDIALLGMGEDGHTASLFAGAGEFAHATEENIVLITPPPSITPPHRRLSMSLAALKKVKTLILYIQGPAKRAVLERAVREAAEGNFAYPISYLLRKEKFYVYACE